ncbi:unnamed protein product [Gemmataceae bacterium]|nr:unnamed protein product [Gemmataceae bacterium]VTT98894.1 unnamed protein product [Gemmataceae bacterium]
MRTEAEIKKAAEVLRWADQNGMIPPECQDLLVGEITALDWVLGVEVKGKNNLSRVVAVIAETRRKLEAEFARTNPA